MRYWITLFSDGERYRLFIRDLDNWTLRSPATCARHCILLLVVFLRFVPAHLQPPTTLFAYQCLLLPYAVRYRVRWHSRTAVR